MYYPHNGPDPESQVDREARSRAIDKSGGDGDFTPSKALDMARSVARDAARSQGGTNLTDPLAGSEKGNSGQVGLGREATNSDPQGFKWTDQPRLDRDGG